MIKQLLRVTQKVKGFHLLHSDRMASTLCLFVQFNVKTSNTGRQTTTRLQSTTHGNMHSREIHDTLE